MKTVVFDLDHTLLKVNSSYCFGMYLFQKGKISKTQLASLLSYYCLHKMRFISLSEVLEEAGRQFFYGRHYMEIAILADDFFYHQMPKLINPQVMSILKQAQKEGHKVILLSSSPDLIVKYFRSDLNLDLCQGTSYFFDEEGLVLKINQVMNGAEKAEYIKRLGLPKNDLIAYTDSYEDLPLLELVGRPVAVNPDKRLKKECLQRGWEILNS